MTVVYIFRSPGTGHSIETVFGSVANAQQRAGIRATSVFLPHVSRGLRSVWQNARFLCTLARNSPPNAIFHVTGDVHYAVLLLPRSRTVLTIHDGSLLMKNRHRPRRYAIFWLLWYGLPVWWVARLTVISEKSRQELIRCVGRTGRKATVIPNGYDPAFGWLPRPFCQRRPVLLQIGTAPHKNVHRLVAAIADLTCTLIVIGPLTDELRDALKTHRIDYRNHADLSKPELIAAYETADIVTFVSTYEGFGMPVLEANAVGRAVLTSDIEPLRSLALGAAHYVDPTDGAAIRAGVLRLIQDDAYRQTLLDAGRVNAQRFTAEYVAGQYCRLYAGVLLATSKAAL